MAQGISLGLGSASGAPGKSVSLDIFLDSTGTTRPAALQWTIGYSTADISSINVTAGSGAITAGKIVACNPTPGSVICVVYGLNNTTVLNGAVATVQLTISASTVNT